MSFRNPHSTPTFTPRIFNVVEPALRNTPALKLQRNFDFNVVGWGYTKKMVIKTLRAPSRLCDFVAIKLHSFLRIANFSPATLYIPKNRATRSTSALLLCILIFHLLASEPAHAQLQELEINPISVDGAIPVFRDHPAMAAIIIRSSLTSLTFVSNMEIVQEHSDPAAGEYILIIEPVTQTIRVNAPGFIAGQIPLRGLSARQVVYYSVEPATRQPGDTLPVVIRVVPTDARAEYNGEPLDLSRSVPLEPGSHTLTLSAEHYHSRTETIDVNPENTFFEFSLEPMQEQLLRIRTEPAAAMVYIDGVEEGTTDRTGVLEVFRFPGTYSVSVLLSGYQNIQRDVAVRAGGQNEALFVLERSAGTLALTVEPAAAEVTVNRQRVDASRPLELAPGTYRLEVARQGYEPYSETITVERGQRLERTISLQAHTGTLLYRVNPSFAQTTLRDPEGSIVEQWAGSRRLEGLQTGEWVLSVRAPEYEPETQTVTIVRDQTAEVSFTLTEGTEQTVTGFSEAERGPVTAPSRSFFSVSAISSFLHNQTFRANYENGYGVQVAYRVYPMPYIFAEVNMGYVYHLFKREHPYHRPNQSLYHLFGGLTAGLQLNINRSVGFSLGAGYRTGAYHLPKDTEFNNSESQAFNTLYGEGGLLLATRPGVELLKGMGLYARYGLASNMGRQPLVEYGISLRF